MALTTKYLARSFEDLVKPLQEYAKAYAELENALAALNDEASTLELQMALEGEDSAVGKLYKNYIGDLHNAVDNLSSQGLSLASRNNLLKMRQRYASEITPITKAMEARLAQRKALEELESTHPDVLFDRRASDTSLDAYFNNPDLSYLTRYGSQLTSLVATLASALAKELRSNPNQMRALLGGDFYEYVKERGFSSEAILNAITQSPNAASQLTRIVLDVLDSSDIQNWNNANLYDRARWYANQGLWQAVGADESQLVNNWRAQQQMSLNFLEKQAKDNRDFLRELQLPRAILDKDGKETGHYYDPKMGMITDKEGNIIGNPNGTISKIGTNSNSISPSDKEEQQKIKDLSKVSSTADLVKLGYTPVFSTLLHHNIGGKRVWHSRVLGEDVPLVTNDWATGTSLITEGGDVTYTPPKKRPATMSVVFDFNTLPSDALEEIKNEAERRGIPLDEDILILRVSGLGRRKDDYDYIIFRNNLNL